MPKRPRSPRLSRSERERRRQFGRTKLVQSAIKATGQKGFTKTRGQLEGKLGIRSATKLAGWLKGQAKEQGVLSRKHPYRGRRKRRR